MSVPVAFYFDYLSPYSYLAVERIHRDPALRAIPFVYRPVSFGSILGRLGTRGPGEIPGRRERMLEDVLLVSALAGIPLAGPPKHPFNSVYALRSTLAVPEEKRPALVRAYFGASWGRGESLEDLSALRRALDTVGIEQDPEEAATDRVQREALRVNTETALAAGVFGVPSFVVDELVFFGQDRLPLLVAYLEGKVKLDRALRDRLAARPSPARAL